MMTEQVMWSPGVTLEAIEKQVILKAYQFYRGNATQAAISLGISEKTIRNKLEKYEQDGLEREAAEERDREERAKILDRQRGIVTDPKTGVKSLLGSNTGAHEAPNNTERLREKPATDTKSVPGMPVQKREEIPLVLQKQASGNNTSRRR